MTEIATGHALGVDLPDLQALDWLKTQTPISEPAGPLVLNLGPGETQVLLKLRPALARCWMIPRYMVSWRVRERVGNEELSSGG